MKTEVINMIKPLSAMVVKRLSNHFAHYTIRLTSMRTSLKDIVIHLFNPL